MWIQISVLSDPPVPRRSPQNVVLQLLQRTETLKSLRALPVVGTTGEQTSEVPSTTFCSSPQALLKTARLNKCVSPTLRAELYFWMTLT